ncbi:MAG: excinuclease ABC subunit UvrC [Chloroflexi bacterium]|nr:excinuclease ABC subunit UvrC [Chloroflexota bacterium]
MVSPLLVQIKSLPVKPGVYLFRDEQGQVLYVGKAASLRSRVRSYFGRAAALTPKLQSLRERVRRVETVITDNEMEALMLECTLIKHHHPRYNVRLKDDKNYPYLKIMVDEDWARVYITRKLEKDGGLYFGPFASAASVRTSLDLVKKLFPYRSCTKPITGQDRRPCLDYHLHRCVGPCIGVVSREEYREVIRQVILFLEGKHGKVLAELKVKMEEASEKLEFERAAVLRDQIQAIEKVALRQKVVSTRGEDEDVVALARNTDEALAQVFFIREGKLMGGDHFLLEGVQDEPAEEIMAQFLRQFYLSASRIPPVLLLGVIPQEAPTLSRWLEERRPGPVRLVAPRRGQKRELVALAEENARQALAQLQAQRQLDSGRTAAALLEFQEQLQLPRLPQRIEAYDISNLGGTSAVGSLVAFQEGRPRKADYRRFRIKTVAGADDYAMLREVLKRRFRRRAAAAPEEGQPWVKTPDLLLIDGGKGQLNAALEALADLRVVGIPVASLAKEREELFVPELAEPVVLPPRSPALHLVQRVRDEAHRFALAYHQKVRRQAALASPLDSVPGIGPKRKRGLLRHFGSLKRLKEASLEELAAAPSMTLKLAQRLQEAL